MHDDELKRVFGESGRVLEDLSFRDHVAVWAVEAPASLFIDRTDLVHDVTQLAESERSGPVVVAIDGLPGSGKSALLRKCAAELRNLFEIAIHFDYGDAAGGPVSPSDVLGAFLQDLGFSEGSIPSDLRSRRSRFLSATTRRRILVLLDGVTEAAQVTQLTPNSPHALVIAAGEFPVEALLADGAHLRKLGGLNTEHGLALLSAVIGEGRVVAESEAAARIVEICAGLPLGLHVSAGRLSSRSDLTLDRLAAEMTELRPAGEAWHELTGVFSSVYRSLDDNTADLFHALGAAPGTRWPTATIVAMFDVREAAEAALRGLVRANLLQPVSGGYVMPELASRYAADRAEATDPQSLRDERRTRMIRALVALSAEADRGINRNRLRISTVQGAAAMSDFATPMDAMDWFSAWHSSILQVIREAAAQGLDQEVWQLFEATWPFHTSRTFHQEWLEGASHAVEAAQRCEDRSAEARMRCFRSRVWMELGEFGNATADIEAAAVLADQTDNLTLRASVADFQGHVYLRQGQHAEALASFTLSEIRHEQVGDQRGVALQAQFRGRVLGRLGQPDEALAALDRAAVVIESFDDHRAQSRILYSRAEVLYGVQRQEQAVQSLNDALVQAGLLGSTDLAIPPLTLLARIARDAGDPATERTCLQRLLEALPDAGSPERVVVEERLADLR
ncbi:hypothetical protein GCM10009745_63040 [Kribbella yunnanensis]|uniref:NB-ARC domain-containing protein n=1 Tax=Kribbella yunnanensis TaxID=190194 RepID=A0ABN2IKJ6_9ACTN